MDTASARIVREAGTIDVLVNSVWGGYERMIDDGAFMWSKPFWEQPLWRWDAMSSAGVRAHYHASQLAVRAMLPRRRGLIVNISFWVAQKHVGNVAYGVSKAATDKMTGDMAAIAADPDRLRHSGKMTIAAALAAEYGFTDLDGKTTRALTVADVWPARRR